jgi:homoserine trans-succinylase
MIRKILPERAGGALLVWPENQEQENRDIDILLKAIGNTPNLAVSANVIQSIEKCKNDFWLDKERVLEWAENHEIDKVYFGEEASAKLQVFNEAERIEKQAKRALWLAKRQKEKEEKRLMRDEEKALENFYKKVDNGGITQRSQVYEISYTKGQGEIIC